MAFISRDPIARTELHRENEYSETDTCAWCGSQRYSTRAKDPAHYKHYLYRFHIESDGGHVMYDGKKFCSKSCRNAYRS